MRASKCILPLLLGLCVPWGAAFAGSGKFVKIHGKACSIQKFWKAPCVKVDWSGSCVNGFAQGRGRVTLQYGQTTSVVPLNIDKGVPLDWDPDETLTIDLVAGNDTTVGGHIRSTFKDSQCDEEGNIMADKMLKDAAVAIAKNMPKLPPGAVPPPRDDSKEINKKHCESLHKSCKEYCKIAKSDKVARGLLWAFNDEEVCHDRCWKARYACERNDAFDYKWYDCAAECTGARDEDACTAACVKKR